MHQNLVIVPTYNEKENISDLITTILGLEVSFDILIVDDNSPDGTAEIVKGLQRKNPGRIHLLEREGKMGLGTAYITGFEYAVSHNYEYIYEMDADFSHNPSDLVKLYLACAEEGYDVAIGSRYVNGVNVINWPMSRVIISYFASQYVRLVTGMPFHDATAGFKCYRKKVLETINPRRIRFIGYAFQIEMKFQAWMYGFHIKEVPIIFTDRTKGTSKMSGSIFWEALFGVINLKLSSFFKKYKKPSIQNAATEASDQ